MKRAFLALLAVAWLAQPVRAASPASCAEIDYGRAAPRAADTPDLRASPPNPDGPTLVSVGIFVVEIGQGRGPASQSLPHPARQGDDPVLRRWR